MELIKNEGFIKWNGSILFSVFDEEKARKQGFLDDNEALFFALENGLLPVKRKIESKNAVTNLAKNQVAQMLTTAGYNVVLPTNMELGTGTGTPAATDTDLWSPSSATIKACSSVGVYMTYYAQYICTWLTTDPVQGTWTEIGLKDPSGNLWAHAVITSPMTVNSGEALVGQWQIQIQ